MCCKEKVFVLRQVLLLTAICTMSFASGVQIAFPSVLNPAILSPDSPIRATSEQASWIAAAIGIGGFVSYAFLPIIFDVYGRKTSNLTTNLLMIAGSLIFYVGNDVYSLATARFVQGLGYGASSLCIITLCECVSPKRRGYFMVINKIFIGFGALFCHVLGLVLNWRQIAVVGGLPNFLSIFFLIITMESPSYFARRAQFEKCEKAFIWYRGDSMSAKKELRELVTAQMENCLLKQRENNISVIKKTKNMLLTKEFRKSFYIVTLATLCIDSCGRVFLMAYVTQILLTITNDKHSASYMSIASDSIMIIALCISTILVKYFNRRTLLFKLGFFSVFLMFLISLTIILRNHFTLLQDIKWLVSSVILFHVFVINVGVVPIAFALPGEVFTLEQKGLGSIMSGFIFLFFFNVVLKITPTLIDNTGVEGTYSIYGFCLFVFLLLLLNLLPETKDKTLQKIEDEIKGIVRKTSEVELLEVNAK